MPRVCLHPSHRGTDPVCGQTRPSLTFTPAQRFFLTYARMWANNITDEFLAYCVNSDVHSPHIFRVNAALPMIDSWYDAFHIQPTDKMFIPKEKRALVW